MFPNNVQCNEARGNYYQYIEPEACVSTSEDSQTKLYPDAEMVCSHNPLYRLPFSLSPFYVQHLLPFAS